MHLRAQRPPFGHAARIADLTERTTDARQTGTTVPPGELTTDPDGSFSAGLHLADVHCSVAYDDEQSFEVLLYHVPTESWATAQVTPVYTATGRYPVRQHGLRRLWAEAEAAHARWIAHGRPARTRYGLTVTPGHHQWWLDETG